MAEVSGFGFLASESAKAASHPTISGVLFDFDGTLTSPQGLDFPAIRAAIGCPEGQTILEFINSLAGEQRLAANSILEEFERRAAEEASPNRGSEELLSYLKSRGLPLGIITRNLRSAVIRSLENFPTTRPEDFRIILTREEEFAPKPDPEGIRVAAQRMAVPVHEIALVGDFRFDIEAANAAGALAIFLANRESAAPELIGSSQPDYIVRDLPELVNLFRYLSPLPAGKLPNDMLTAFLGELKRDGSVVIGPAAGEDVAVVNFDGDHLQEQLLVLKSDPITFVTDRIGYYSVAVNTNDLATAGCQPRWLVTTLLFPPGSTPSAIHAVIRDLQSACSAFGLALCGGHTEITPAVCQPTVVAFCAGTVTPERLIRKDAVRPGDRVLLTKAAGIEGTAILGREHEDALLRCGARREEIARSQDFLLQPGISVLAEARIAAEHPGVSAMHDVTEGGVATALEELSQASGHGLQVRLDRIPVLPETAKLCSLLGLNPLGLIGSGALLICCRPEAAEEMRNAILAAGIEASIIGDVLEAGMGVGAIDSSGRDVAWPRFERDEITRI